MSSPRFYRHKGVMSADDGPIHDALGSGRLSFLERELPPSFELRLIVVPPGCQRAFDEVEWRDALVIVERGEIDLECTGGTTRRFRAGDVLYLTGLPLRALLNRAQRPALLVAVSRRSLTDPPDP